MSVQTIELLEEQSGTDPFVFDQEALHKIASDAVVKRGLAYFKENRVIELERTGAELLARVEGSDPSGPYPVALRLEGDRDLAVDCGCLSEDEPVCKHAVAALVAWGARQPIAELTVRSAADREIEDRTKRGRVEVRVQHQSGDPWFGTWTARSLDSTTGKTHRVQIRSLTERRNLCSCPDFAVNHLGTCKHIEAVLHAVRKKRRRAPEPGSYVYLDWGAPSAPRVRLHRGPGLTPELRSVAQQRFDAEGFLQGLVPDAVYDLAHAADGLPIGDDVLAYASRLAEEAVHARRKDRIRAEIARSGGQLPGVRARLYPYQMDGVAFLASNGRAVLADDMGLGKTLQAIAAAAWLAENAEVRRTLVICPASLKHQWAREIARFTGKEAVVVQGGPDARGALYRQRAEVTIVNYELCLRDATVLNEVLVPDLVILDEAQRIKNWRTKIAACVKSVRSRYAFVLSGTPLENRLEDLYSLLQVVDGRVLGPLWRYLLDFHVTDERGKVLGYRNLGELRRRIAPVLLRRDRRLVRDQLPDRIEQRLDVPLSEKQKELHDTGLSAAATLAHIMKRRPLTPSEEHKMLAALQTARMACDAAGLVDHETEGSPKLEELERLLEELCLDGGRKAVVFSQWERMTAMAEGVARRLGLGSVRLHGGVPSGQRGALIERFRDDPAVQVFFSTDAGGVGLNLQAASVLINLDMPWNPGVLEQRIGRVHRLGQTEPVQVLLLLAADSYEQKVAALLGGKQQLFDNVIGEGDGADVVGISKRMLDWVVETLADGISEAEPEEQDAPLALPTPPVPDAAGSRPPAKDDPADARLRAAIARLDAALPGRIERVMASKGALLVVVAVVDAEAEAAVERASEDFQVALIDARTAAALGRLGAASPIGAATEVYARPAVTEAPLAALAQRKLRAAEVLAERGCGAEAIPLLADAMLAALALRAGRSDAPPAATAAAWLFGEAVPKGLVEPLDAATVTKALCLAGAPEMPEALVDGVLADARRVVGAMLMA